jgi:hypothetical protein
MQHGLGPWQARSCCVIGDVDGSLVALLNAFEQ